jgi:periplasmic divalent cation tolerance protein
MAEPVEPLVVWVYVTASCEEEAVRLARVAVEERLAACANVLGSVRSIYRWEEELRDESEAAFILKTTDERFGALEERLRALHSYESPCILSFSASGGSEAFRSWVREETRS